MTGLGIFVAVDGPKHAGKSEVLQRTVPALRAEGLTVLLTKEPTPRFDLSNEERFSGLALARLIAADRASHLRDTITPGLATHDVVITDRYIASSLVFQVLDGVPFEQVWALNASYRRPDLNVFLMANEQSITRRARQRDAATRFDRAGRVAAEIAQYETARASLAELGVNTLTLANSDSQPLHHTAEALRRLIVHHVEARHG